MTRKFAHILTATLLVLGVIPLVTGPAQAVSYRDLRSVRYGSCVYAYGDPLEGLHMMRCNTTPAKYGNWAVELAGYHNNHPLWILRRQGGRCMGVLGNASSNYLYAVCDPVGSKNVWEVFTTSSGRYVLKSFGAYQSWRVHRCMNFNRGNPYLGACSLTSTTAQIYR